MAKQLDCKRCGKKCNGGRRLQTNRFVCNRCYGQLDFTEGPVPNYAIDDGITPETYRTKSGQRPQRLVKTLGALA